MFRIILIDLLIILNLVPVILFPQNTNDNSKPKLVVGIVIDQMRYDYLSRFKEKFSEGGFNKLMNEGTFCKNAHQNFFISQSAPGYATIVAGTTPSMHGIISNEWYDRLKNKLVNCVEDESYKAIGGNSNNGHTSPLNLITSTIGDELKLASYFQSKVISVSLNEIGAAISGGRTPNAAYWLNEKTGTWMTSSYYTASLPDWVNQFNDKKLPDIYLEREWTTFLPIDQYKESMQDHNTYEIGIRSQNSFPYNLKDLKIRFGDYSILKYTPFGNTYTKDFAIASIMNDSLGKDNNTDFISICFSANDYITNLYGPRSVEIEDTYIRLDQDLTHLISFLDGYIGKGKFLIYLTSNKGTSDIPQFLEDVKQSSGYFDNASAMSVMRSYLKAISGKDNLVLAYADNQIYLDQFLIEKSKLSLNEIQLKAAQLIVQFSGVAHALTGTAMQTTNYTEGIFQQMQNSYFAKRSGDIFVNFYPGWSERNGEQTTQPKVAKDYSGYNYNTHVPLIWYGWKIKPKEVYRKISLSDIAPSLSEILNIAYPNGCTGQAIEELF